MHHVHLICFSAENAFPSPGTEVSGERGGQPDHGSPDLPPERTDATEI